MEQFRTFVLSWLEKRGWSQARLAEAAEISQSLLSKYLSDDPRKRVTPGPNSLEKLAPVLDVPYEDLMRMCGYLPGTAEATDRDELDRDVTARVAELMAAVRGTPRWAWTTIIKNAFDRALADVADMNHLLAEMPAEDRVVPTTANEASDRRGIGRPARRQRPIKPRHQAMLIGALG